MIELANGVYESIIEKGESLKVGEKTVNISIQHN